MVEHETEQSSEMCGSVGYLARLAIATGLFMFVFEVVRNWGEWQPWPGWVIDYLCGSLLIFGGWQALRPPPHQTTTFMCAAWGFFCCLLWGSFFGNVEHWEGENYGPIPQKLYTIMVGGFFAYAVVVFIWCMIATRPIVDHDNHQKERHESRS